MQRPLILFTTIAGLALGIIAILSGPQGIQPSPARPTGDEPNTEHISVQEIPASAAGSGDALSEDALSPRDFNAPSAPSSAQSPRGNSAPARLPLQSIIPSNPVIRPPPNSPAPFVSNSQQSSREENASDSQPVANVTLPEAFWPAAPAVFDIPVPNGVPLPAALATAAPGAHLSPKQEAAIDEIAADFAEQVTPPDTNPDEPVDARQWQSARAAANARYRKIFGWSAFNKHNTSVNRPVAE